jgi:DNA primase
MQALRNYAECPKCGGNHKARPFCIYEDGEHCFSCGHTKSRQMWLPGERKQYNAPEFPDSSNRLEEFSLEAQMWLAKFNMDASAVREQRIHYKHETNSLVFPSFDADENLVCYQERNMKERYITTKGEKKPHKIVGSNTEVVVLVEDFISAVRVNSSGYTSICLWGTKFNYNEIDEEFKKHSIILVWLDNDSTKQTNSGQEAAKKIMGMGKHLLWNKYGFSFEKSIANIVTDKDPKYYVDSDIKNFIKGALAYG